MIPHFSLLLLFQTIANRVCFFFLIKEILSISNLFQEDLKEMKMNNK